MSDRRSRTSVRGFGVISSVIGFAAYLMLAAVPAQAVANSCTYNSVNRQVTFDMNGLHGWLGVSAGDIMANDDTAGTGATQCGTATVNNTDGITVDGDGSTGVLVLDLRGGPFAPGESPEASGTAEIEINATVGTASLSAIAFVGSDNADDIVAGDNNSGATSSNGDGAVNWDGDSDADVTFLMGSGNEVFEIDGFGGADLVSLNGGSGHGGPLEQISTFVFGGDGNDTLTGTSFDADGTPVDSNTGDTLAGNDGNDTLNGLGGDDQLEDDGNLDPDTTCATDELDVLNGGDGEDDLFAGTGRDLLDGGNGNDDEFGEDCNDTFDQGNGPNGADDMTGGADEAGDPGGCGPSHDDVVDYSQRNSELLIDLAGPGSGEVGASENDGIAEVESALGGTAGDLIGGGNDDNFLAGGPGDDEILAADGDDCVQPGAGDDTADGGSQPSLDTIDYADAPNGVTVDLDAETATGHGIDSVVRFEAANGSAFNDTLLGDENENLLIGGAGNDTMDGRDASDVYVGLGGDDTITDTGDSTDEDDAVEGGAGNDTIDVGIGDDTAYGDDDDFEPEEGGNDTIEGGEGEDTLFGGGGNDSLTDSGTDPTDNDDHLNGGDGSDTMTDLVAGEDGFNGDDDANGFAGDGNDVVNSGSGDDTGNLDGGNDSITDSGDDPDGGCNDSFFGDAGDDVIHIGDGRDDAAGADGDDEIFGEGGDDDCDGLFGGDGDDFISGGEGDDDLRGNDDTDSLHGDAGEDEIEGDDGADKVEGGLGDDELDGDGQGFSAPDTLLYTHAPSGVDVDMSLGFAEGGDGNDVVNNFEKAKGSKFDDSIKGGETGGGGGTNFALAGGKGDDVLTGSTSNDTLKGGGGNDLMIGLGGADVLKGGNGKDQGDGGKGKDLCFAVETRNSCDKA